MSVIHLGAGSVPSLFPATAPMESFSVVLQQELSPVYITKTGLTPALCVRIREVKVDLFLTPHQMARFQNEHLIYIIL